MTGILIILLCFMVYKIKESDEQANFQTDITTMSQVDDELIHSVISELQLFLHQEINIIESYIRCTIAFNN